MFFVDVDVDVVGIAIESYILVTSYTKEGAWLSAPYRLSAGTRLTGIKEAEPE